MGLSIPFEHFQGRFKAGPAQSDAEKASNNSLKAFADYLGGLSPAVPGLDLNRLNRDLEAGLHFESNIPQGFGSEVPGPWWQRFMNSTDLLTWISTAPSRTRMPFKTSRPVWVAWNPFFMDVPRAWIR